MHLPPFSHEENSAIYSFADKSDSNKPKYQACKEKVAENYEPWLSLF